MREHVPRGYGKKPRKQRCPETWDLLDSFRKTRSQRLALKKPRFADILRQTGNVDPDDTRSDLERFLHYVKGYAHKRKGRTLVTLADNLLAAFHWWQQLNYTEQQFIRQLNRGADYDRLQASQSARMAEIDAHLVECLQTALKALRRLRYSMDQDLALMVEVPYLLLRGNKAVMIALCHRGCYSALAEKYPYFWSTIAWHPEAADDDDHDADHPFPYPRCARRLCPLTDKDKAKRFLSPVMVYQLIQQKKLASKPVFELA